jgi:osmotically-inducible protein OsmY
MDDKGDPAGRPARARLGSEGRRGAHRRQRQARRGRVNRACLQLLGEARGAPGGGAGVRRPRGGRRDQGQAARLEHSRRRDVADEIAREFQWNTLIPETIEAEVRNGVVAVWGEVEWAYRREEAEQAVRYLRGVTGVTNLITVKPRVKPSEIEQRIREAIAPAAALDARQIWVTTSNGTVHLHGHVHSLFEKKVADDAAKSAPGVIEVDNEIEVTP